MLRRVFCSLVIGLFLFAHNTASADTAKMEKAATAAAMTWLKGVDAGKYGDSWKAASDYLRQSVSVHQWRNAVKSVRTPLGRLISRKVMSTTYTRTLPGVPDGQYVVVQFSSSFENKSSAIETVTPMMETDGLWRVSGYFVQ